MATLALSVAGQFVGGAIGGPIGATIGRALGALAGAAIDQQLFGEKPQPRAGAYIRISGSTEGGAVPRLYGWSRLSGNILWATELERLKSEDSGAKGTQQAPDEEIVASFAIGLCEGEVTRLGRIWADGQLLETAGLNLRFYRGTATQEPDSLIEARQGEAPAYRGLCYIVFERLPLGEFGNRIPNITVELCRVVGELEPLIRSVTVIPGATEFGYDPVARVRVVGRGSAARENAHASALVSDWTLSIDELQELCPNLEHVALVVSWFGDDLRAGECSVRPKVEAASREVKGAEWGVAGLSRNEAQVVSTHEGGPAYGGTPSDSAVIAAIADLKARGLEVTLYPMLLMDVPADNEMGQPAYPWRGRIAPETDAAAEAAAFVGGTGDWGYRRFVRHYAPLAEEAGAEALVIGSEMVGLTTARAAGGFPFVDALVSLAAEAKGLAPSVDLTYAADWSEYHGFQPPEAPDDKLFHLDPLWASDDIAAVGIDNYMPIADWRDGEDGPDAGAGPYGLGYLEAGIDGGEGFDWYYASDADRLAGARTPISDGAHGEHWVWRFKDIAGWWGNAHHDRVGGVRSAVPTAWVPGSKPIWFTELGCGAVDKGANQPNVFPDGKSSEDGRPHFSSGAPDGLMQRQFLRAHLNHWQGHPMVGRISLWTWDARPYPAFPSDGETWADAVNHPAGHWLTGRLGALALDELARAVAEDFGVELGAADVAGTLVQGVAIEGVVSWRDATGSALAAAGLSVRDGPTGLELVRPNVAAAVTLARDDLVKDDGPVLGRRRPDPSETVARLAVGFVDRERDYLAGTVTAMRPEGAAMAGENGGLVLDAAAARSVAEQLLRAKGTERDTLEFTLPPSAAALEVGDVVAVEGEGEGPFEIAEIRDGLARRVTARAVPPVLKSAVLSDRPARVAPGPVPVAEPVVIAAHLPPDPAAPGQSQLLLAAYASPWPGEVEVQVAATGARVARLAGAAAIGELVTPLTVGPVHMRDRRGVEIELSGGHLAPVDFEAALAGANRIAVETDAGEWEVLGFAGAELVSPGRYRLGDLLRGLGGTDVAMGAAGAGNRLVVLDGNVALVPVGGYWLGGELALRAFAGRHDGTGAAVTATVSLGPVLPLPPAHLRAVRGAGGDVALSWVRRSRADAGSWAAAEVPLDHAPEAYRVTIFDGGDVVRTIEVVAPAATYATAAQVADFGTLPAAFDFTVAQLSPVYGAGHAGAATFNA